MSAWTPETQGTIHAELADIGLLAITAHIPLGDYTGDTWARTIERLSGDLDVIERQLRDNLELIGGGKAEMVASIDMIHVAHGRSSLARTLRVNPKELSALIVELVFGDDL